jgi:CRP/FNR family transcriptional regulator, cyclic AMP receptor protein
MIEQPGSLVATIDADRQYRGRSKTMAPSLFPTVERTVRALLGGRGLSRVSPQVSARKLEFLHEVDILRDLTPDEMLWLKDTTQMVTCEPGRVIYSQDDEAEVLFILKRGRVQLYRTTADGKKLEIATIGAGTFFGEMPLVGQRMHEAFAEAMEESLICVMSRDDVERLIAKKPQVAVRMLEVLSERLSASQTRIEALAFHSVPSRLAAVLLRLDGGQGLRTTHQELADTIGAYRETVTKTLDEFQRDGLVELSRGHVTIRDRARLEEKI